mmetsp:Transcript_129423/g.227960  ORF Transcript_129423/g.227960 Transcript_129423/m.227960 type:complete len:216 (-) Transcript_129423:139-786(-)
MVQSLWHQLATPLLQLPAPQPMVLKQPELMLQPAAPPALLQLPELAPAVPLVELRGPRAAQIRRVGLLPASPSVPLGPKPIREVSSPLGPKPMPLQLPAVRRTLSALARGLPQRAWAAQAHHSKQRPAIECQQARTLAVAQPLRLAWAAPRGVPLSAAALLRMQGQCSPLAAGHLRVAPPLAAVWPQRCCSQFLLLVVGLLLVPPSAVVRLSRWR